MQFNKYTYTHTHKHKHKHKNTNIHTNTNICRAHDKIAVRMQRGDRKTPEAYRETLECMSISLLSRVMKYRDNIISCRCSSENEYATTVDIKRYRGHEKNPWIRQSATLFIKSDLDINGVMPKYKVLNTQRFCRRHKKVLNTIKDG